MSKTVRKGEGYRGGRICRDESGFVVCVELSPRAFLEEAANIPLTHVLTPGAMGETHPAAPQPARPRGEPACRDQTY
jgi:hypothetical protein